MHWEEKDTQEENLKCWLSGQLEHRLLHKAIILMASLLPSAIQKNISQSHIHTSYRTFRKKFISVLKVNVSQQEIAKPFKFDKFFPLPHTPHVSTPLPPMLQWCIEIRKNMNKNETFQVKSFHVTFQKAFATEPTLHVAPLKACKTEEDVCISWPFVASCVAT